VCERKKSGSGFGCLCVFLCGVVEKKTKRERKKECIPCLHVLGCARGLFVPKLVKIIKSLEKEKVETKKNAEKQKTGEQGTMG